jgi:hypothetical protein
MSKVESIAVQLLKLRIFFATIPTVARKEGDVVPDEDQPEEFEALDLLLEVFLKGEGKQYNKNANYDFLASVFANVSTVHYILYSISPQRLISLYPP